MRKYLFPITLLILFSAILFPLYPFFSESRLVTIPYGIVSSSLLAVLLGIVGVQLLRMKKHHLFVCAECDLTFLNEKDLRSHYGIKHIKKD